MRGKGEEKGDGGGEEGGREGQASAGGEGEGNKEKRKEGIDEEKKGKRRREKRKPVSSAKGDKTDLDFHRKQEIRFFKSTFFFFFFFFWRKGIGAKGEVWNFSFLLFWNFDPFFFFFCAFFFFLWVSPQTPGPPLFFSQQKIT